MAFAQVVASCPAPRPEVLGQHYKGDAGWQALFSISASRRPTLSPILSTQGLPLCPMLSETRLPSYPRTAMARVTDQEEGPHSGHLGTAWETAVVAVFAVIIVVVGIVAFYFRRRRMRRRLTDRIHSPANFTRDPEQGAISPSFENSPRSREMRGIGDVDASIAKPERAVSSSSPRQSISSPHHSEITQKQGTFKSPRYYWEPK